MIDLFDPLTVELDRWADAGRTAPLWLRDDDAIQPTPALDRLLQVAARVPVTLAVIPEPTGPALAARLDQASGVTVAVHGWRHQDHSRGRGKKCELGDHRPAEAVLAELQQGVARLAQLHPDRFVPVLVPPWNRIDQSLLPHLPAIGFRAVSVFGRVLPDAPLPMINTHVDLIDWRGSRGGRDTGLLVAEIVDRLRRMFRHGGVMGLLTHHLVHDDRAWRFIDDLLEVADHPGCQWVGLGALVAAKA